ncbi:hypothetical protein, partial [Rhodopirellula bahusiensis]|uniref:hypothetical protein n=1 Tax=Rhodopirellula bahusiensis TaxID=2014065 RepID=UPI003264CAC7
MDSSLVQHTKRQISSETPSLLDNAVEGLLYAVIFLSPWAFGCTDAVGEFYLTFGISLILLLGCARWMTGSPPAWRGRRTGASLLVGTCVLAASAATHLLPVPNGVREWIAPGVAQWLAPAEWLGAQDDPSIWNAGRGLTVYSGGSFLMLVRLGLTAGLCLVIGTMPNLRRVLFRTSVLTTVLGTALALFGIAQHYGSHDQLLYWSIPIEGGLGFGPFANRNHYPFFLNLTLGLAIGL